MAVNREIKFRGFNNVGEDVEDWIGGRCMLSWENLQIDNTGIFVKFNNGKSSSKADNVIPMQYTGLKDKNGVEIYEGDILHHHKQGNRFVEYGSPFGNWGGYMLVSKEGMRGTCNDTKIYEVIGNIYENKELLEQ